MTKEMKDYLIDQMRQLPYTPAVDELELSVPELEHISELLEEYIQEHLEGLL